MDRIMQDLHLGLQAELQDISLQAPNLIQRSERSYKATAEKLKQLKERHRQVRFDEQQEILFYKEVKPKFLKELLFHGEIYQIETHKPVATREFQKTYYSQTLAGVGFHFERNLSFYNYIRLGRTDLDAFFFGPRNSDDDPLELIPGYLPGLDSEQHEVYSYKLGKLYAFEQVHDFLAGALAAIDGATNWPEPINSEELVWTDSKASFIELIYAIFVSGSVNHGRGHIKTLMNAVGRLFNVDPGNFYRVMQGFRIRKERTQYTDSLPVKLAKYMDDTDLQG